MKSLDMIEEHRDGLWFVWWLDEDESTQGFPTWEEAYWVAVARRA